MIGHRFDNHFVTPRLPEFWLRPAILRHDPGLAASPRVRYKLGVGRSFLSVPFSSEPDLSLHTMAA
jgi:hypothetical protein